MFNNLPTICDSCTPHDAQVYTIGGLPDAECDVCGIFGPINMVSHETGQRVLRERLEAELAAHAEAAYSPSK